MQALKTDLIGITGNNGLRGEFRQYRGQAEKREQQIIRAVESVAKKLQAMDEARQKGRRWLIGIVVAGISASSAAVTVITRLLG